MRHLSLFTGAGGSEWTALLIGWETVAAVEIDPYCQRVLRARQDDGSFPPFPIHDDVRTFGGAAWRGRADVISAGFPCQPFSSAGKRRGADDPRNLWPETARIIDEARPEWVFLENSPRLRNRSTGYYLGAVLGDLARSGYDAAWGVLSARTVGAPHQRARLWIVGHLSDTDGTGLWAQQKRERGRDGEAKLGATGEGWGPLSQRVSWSAEPEMARVAYGVASGGNRIGALGNGWVPQQAAEAWRLLSARLVDAQNVAKARDM